MQENGRAALRVDSVVWEDQASKALTLAKIKNQIY